MAKAAQLAHERKKAQFDVGALKVVWAGSQHAVQISDFMAKLVASDPTAWADVSPFNGSVGHETYRNRDAATTLASATKRPNNELCLLISGSRDGKGIGRPAGRGQATSTFPINPCQTDSIRCMNRTTAVFGFACIPIQSAVEEKKGGLQGTDPLPHAKKYCRSDPDLIDLAKKQQRSLRMGTYPLPPTDPMRGGIK